MFKRSKVRSFGVLKKSNIDSRLSVRRRHYFYDIFERESFLAVAGSVCTTFLGDFGCRSDDGHFDFVPLA